MNRLLVITIILIKAQGPLGQVLGNAKQRGRLSLPVVPLSMDHSLGSLSLTGTSKGFSRALLKVLPWGHTDASGISTCFCILHLSLELWAASFTLWSGSWVLWAVPTSCFLELFFFFFPVCCFVDQFYVWVIWKRHEKQSQWREGHAFGSICIAVHLLKQALFAQVFKCFGAGTSPLHRFELVLRWWQPNFEWGL